MMRRQTGLTLVELLLAMAITVVIGAISYRFLDSAIRMGEQTNAELDQLNALDRVWTIMANDLEHISLRQVVRSATGVDNLPALFDDVNRPVMMAASGSAGELSMLLQRDGSLLWLTRHAWSNPLQLPRSELQRVVYRHEGTRLYRESWPEANQPLAEPPASRQLLVDDAEFVALRFLPHGSDPADDAWTTGWPIEQGATAGLGPDRESARARLERQIHGLPSAVEVSLHSTPLGMVRRTFVLPVR